MFLENPMNTTALLTRSTPHPALKAGAEDVRMRAPDDALVTSRLAGLSLASMPWLRDDADLTQTDGGPELCGPGVYRG